MKKRNVLIVVCLILVVALTACAPTSAPENEPAQAEEQTPAEAPVAEPAEASLWTQDYITKVPPIMMTEPYFEVHLMEPGPAPPSRTIPRGKAQRSVPVSSYQSIVRPTMKLFVPVS